MGRAVWNSNLKILVELDSGLNSHDNMQWPNTIQKLFLINSDYLFRDNYFIINY